LSLGLFVFKHLEFKPSYSYDPAAVSDAAIVQLYVKYLQPVVREGAVLPPSSPLHAEFFTRMAFRQYIRRFRWPNELIFKEEAKSIAELLPRGEHFGNPKQPSRTLLTLP
jgi:hypothetical protein